MIRRNKMQRYFIKGKESKVNIPITIQLFLYISLNFETKMRQFGSETETPKNGNSLLNSTAVGQLHLGINSNRQCNRPSMSERWLHSEDDEDYYEKIPSTPPPPYSEIDPNLMGQTLPMPALESANHFAEMDEQSSSNSICNFIAIPTEISQSNNSPHRPFNYDHRRVQNLDSEQQMRRNQQQQRQSTGNNAVQCSMSTLRPFNYDHRRVQMQQSVDLEQERMSNQQQQRRQHSTGNNIDNHTQLSSIPSNQRFGYDHRRVQNGRKREEIECCIQ